MRKTGTGTRLKAGWLGNVTGFGWNVMRLLISKRLLLVVRPEAVARDSNGVDGVSILVRLNEVWLDRQRHFWRYWGNFPPRRWRWNRQDCRLWRNDDGECRLCDGALKYFGRVNNGLLLGVAKLGKRGDRGWIGEGLRQSTRCDNDCVDGGGFRHRTLVRKNCTVLAVRLALVFGA